MTWWRMVGRHLTSQCLPPPTQTEVTKTGYMPSLQAPAHKFDTLKAVVKRCMQVSSVLGQRYTVITVDQAIEFHFISVNWNGLHQNIGENWCTTRWPSYIIVLPEDYWHHMNGSGPAETWMESALLEPNGTKHALNGKVHKRAMRAHKLTAQAL